MHCPCGTPKPTADLWLQRCVQHPSTASERTTVYVGIRNQVFPVDVRRHTVCEVERSSCEESGGRSKERKYRLASEARLSSQRASLACAKQCYLAICRASSRPST